MSITRLTDQQVQARVQIPDDVEMLEKLAAEVGKHTLYSAAIFQFPGGIRVHVVDRSGRSILDEERELPTISDDMFTTASKRKELRIMADKVRAFIRNNAPKGAA